MIKDNKGIYQAAKDSVKGLSDAQLLALATDTTEQGCKGLLLLNKGLRGLITNQAGATEKQSVALNAVLEISRRFLAEQVKRGDTLSDPDAVRLLLTSTLRDRKSEVFACLFLDNRHRLIAFEELFYGTIDGASAHPREVVRRALHHNASAVIFAHNHPSGVAEPSAADERITQKLKDALLLVDVRALDHFIIGDRIVSMAERGLM